MSQPTLGRCANTASYCLKTSFACLLITFAGFIGVANAQQSADGHAHAYSGGRNTRALITQPIDEARLLTLAGNTHPAANAENDRGAVESSFPLEHMQLVLQRPAELEKSLEAFMQEQQRKGSPEYHHWLNAKEFADRYGVSPQDIEKVSNWLQNHGFRVDNVLPSGMAIEFSGTAGQVKQAFHTEIHNLEVEGQPHFANMSDPQIPASLTGVVVGVHALHNFMPHSMMKRHSDFTMVDGSTTFYAVVPADLATIYNLNPAYANGITGLGQTVAVIEDTLLANANDVATFRSAFGLSGYKGTFSQITATGTTTCNNSGVNGDEGEAALDAEWAGASAPDASILLASCADTTTVFGGLIALQNLINRVSPPQIVSISYGECEASNGAAANLSYKSTYQEATAVGVSVFVSSGDEGAASCDPNRTVATHGIAVSGFTSTPYNVSVGGTDFGDLYSSLQPDGLPLSTYWSASNTAGTDGSALSYIPEIPWNDSCASELIYTTPSLAGSAYTQSYGTSGFCNSATGKADFRTTGSGSGGPSTYEVGNKPFWQSVLGNPSDNTRDIPDVSLFAANGVWNHFLLFCLTDTAQGGTSCDYSSSNYTNVLNDLAAGGTSFSSPIMAGIQALVNQSQGATPANPTAAQGNPNPRYYALGDIEFGTNGSSVCNSSLGTGMSSTCVFNDVTLGDIDVNCRGTATSSENCYGYTGTTSTAVQGALSTSTSTLSIAYGTNSGWDFATGLGSVNAYNLIQNWDSVQTTTTVTSSSSLLALDESVTFTATITPAIGSTETGSVAWSGNTGCASSTVSAGVATCTTTSLPLGTDSVTATYGGDANYAGSNGSIAQNVVPAPAITSSASATFIIGTAGSFIVTTTGTPTPAISEAGTLPAGVSFTDNGDGTATISGTPAVGTGAAYSLTITADNGTTNAMQSFTLTVILPQEQFTATANPAAGGAITPASGSFFNQGTVVPIVATPATGYTFVGWTSTADPVASATSASTTVTMNGPESVTAQFSPNLVVNTIADDSGTATNCTAQATAGTNSVDSSCSLRDALLHAASSGAGNISFDSTVFSASNTAAQNTITLQYHQLVIPGNTSINGATSGLGASLANLVTVSVANNITSTVFIGQSGATTSSINGLIITGGTESGIVNNGNLIVTNTTLAHNQGGSGGAIENLGTMQLSNSTLTANNAVDGGCIFNDGNLTVTNTTLTACIALTNAGAIDNNSTGVLTVQSSTIYANSAGNTGGGILNYSGPITMTNSIVSGNSAPVQPNYNGSIVGVVENNVIGGSPSLEGLGNYGGPTQTMLPLPGSSALCAGTASGAGGISDQRGFPRSAVYGGTTCFDAGAVQSNYALSFATEPPATVNVNTPMSPAPVVELTESGVPFTAAGGTIYMTDSNSQLQNSVTSAGTVGGYATFDDLRIYSVESGDTLTASMLLTNIAPYPGGPDNIPLNITAGSNSVSSVEGPNLILTVAANNSAWGSTTPASGSSYPTETVVPIVATANPGYYFVNWTGSGDIANTTAPSTTITINGSETITANFAQIPILVVNTTADDSGADSATNCSAQTTAGLTTTPDNCTLRDASDFANAAGAGNISFDTTIFNAGNSVAQNTITVQNGYIGFSAPNTSINGLTAGSGTALTNLVTVSGGGTSAILGAGFGGVVTFNNLNIVNGNGSSQGIAGGIYNGGAAVTVNDCVVSGNVDSSGDGGGITNIGTMTVTNSAIFGNTVTASGGQQAVGGGILSSGSLTVVNSTFSGNTATASGQGIGGAIFSNNGQLNLTNTTITLNSADGQGGGIYDQSSVPGDSMANSIITGNTAPSSPDVFNAGNLTDIGGNQVTTGFVLSPLAHLGGPAQTQLPLPGDPAICGGTLANATAASLATDQRGYPFDPACPAGAVDSGAVQTNYALAFSTEPPSTAVQNVALAPAPVVQLTESGVLAAAASSSVSISGNPTALSGTASASLSAGSATFSGLTVPTATSSETLTATLALNSTINLTANSTAISVPTINTPAAIASPAPGAVLTNFNQSFTWTSATGATGYVLSLGTTGAGSFNLLYSGQLTTNSAILKVLPTNGETVYARLFTNFNGTWLHVDYTYTATAQAAMVSPAPSSTLTGPIETFTWTPATGATGYLLSLGSTGAGSYNLYYSGQLATTAAALTTLPTNGETVYARLFTNYNGTWVHTDYTYTAATVTPLSPLSGSTLPGPDVTFKWPAASGATGYVLALGTTGPGSYNLYYSGSQTALSATVNGLPVNGATIYARLSTNFNGTWVHADSIYSASTQAALTSPAPSSTLSGSNVTFAWTSAVGATGYVLELGSTGVGSYNLYYSGQSATTNATAKTLPTNGETIYARLLTNYNGIWVHTDYTFTAAP